MVTAALVAVVLMAEPAFLSSGADRRVRLVADAPVEAPPELNDFTGWTRTQLRAEHDRLAAMRPGIGLPIGLMVTGGGAFLTGAYFWLIMGGTAGGPGAGGLLIMLAVVSVISAALVITGGILLVRALPERRAVGRQMARVEKLAESRPDDSRPPRHVPPPAYEEPPIIGPPPEGPPPLPLPPMPQSSAFTFPIFFARF